MAIHFVACGLPQASSMSPATALTITRGRDWNGRISSQGVGMALTSGLERSQRVRCGNGIDSSTSELSHRSLFLGASSGCGILERVGFGGQPRPSNRSSLSFQNKLLTRRNLPRTIGAVAEQQSPNPSSVAGLRNKKKPAKQVTLVDPLEAKRLAQLAMEQQKKRKQLIRQMQVEAVNGGWAVIGVSAAAVGEGLTGKGIVGQVELYVDKVSLYMNMLDAPSLPWLDLFK